jgi:fructose-bisphosphate aldolase class I
VVSLAAGLPTHTAIATNAQALARYAALCQEAGLVPVVEPEVLMAGSHDLARCACVTEAMLRAVFAHAADQGVLFEGMVLKTNMVLPGTDCPVQDGPDAVARATLDTLMRAVPAAVPAVLFLSGGQTARLASARLNDLQAVAAGVAPWPLSFSFARAIQQPALDLWRGDDTNRSAAQAVLAHRAACNRAARQGEYLAAIDAPG